MLNTLYHLHVYLKQNGEQDGFDPSKHTVEVGGRKEAPHAGGHLDPLQPRSRPCASVEKAYGTGRYNEACKELEHQIVEVLSQGYVRMVRNELWNDTPKEKQRRLAIFAVLGHALSTLDMLLHPVSPYLTEYLHQEVFAKGAWKRPLLLEDLPKLALPKAAKAESEAVEFALVVEGACNSAREKAKLKRRWPLRSMEVYVPPEKAAKMKRAQRLISLLCNVKKVSFATKVSSLPVSVTLTPNRSQIGAHFKEKTNDVLAASRSSRGTPPGRPTGAARPSSSPPAKGEKVDVPVSAMEFNFRGTGDWEAAARGETIVAIEKVRDDKLMAEGVERDVARRLQALRKKRGYLARRGAREGKGRRPRRGDGLHARAAEEAPGLPRPREGGRGPRGAGRRRRVGGGRAGREADIPRRLPRPTRPERSWVASDGGRPDSSIFFAALSTSYSDLPRLHPDLSRTRR